MDRIGDRKVVNERRIEEEQQDLGSFPANDGRFDASQYAFFGRDVTQDVELGGLDDDDDEDIGHLHEIEDDVYSSTASRAEIGAFDVSSEVEDVGELTSSFLKLNAIDSGDRFRSQLDEVGITEKDVHDFPVDVTWAGNEYERNQWAQSRQSSQQTIAELQQRTEELYQRARTSDSSQQTIDDLQQRAEEIYQRIRSSSDSGQQQQQWWRDGGSIQPPGYNLPKSHGWPGQAPASSSGPVVNSAFKSQQFTNPQMAQAMMGPWLQSNVAPIPPGAVRHPLPQQNPLMPSQVVLQQYQRSQGYPAPPSFAQIQQQQQQQQQQAMSMSQKSDLAGLGDFRDPRGRQQTPRGSPDSSYGSRKSLDSSPQMRSKYMTTDEIDTIVRIQWAATHGSDPYIDDYYHQAMQSKQAGGTPHGRRHFAPSHLRELPSHARTAAEPHAFLQVDALGRIPFSSIRRPRPLLDVDGVNSTGDRLLSSDSASSQRRLEQEPMLAARIAVEDGLCLLLDVDDIDRMLAVSQHPDGGGQLRRRRQMLLEGLAASLQLVDPLAPGSAMRDSSGRFGLAAKDDLVFLRLVSLPKGRKLLTRYLRLLVPGSELVRIVLMAVFRHLRFLFGGVQSDPSAAASSTGLANAVAATIKTMDLPSLSACLAAVVLASEPPPLRPVGSPSGDGATVALQAVLDRATSILTDRNVQYPLQNTSVWQASFDAFFGLLSKYCTNKYESIMHSLLMASAGSSAAINAAAAAAMTREMPIELLRSSLPHTNENQRKRLLELAQRSLVMGVGVGDGHVSAAAAVRG
ncbi:protein PAT1 homolog [Selaginella moellendorffii]|uniref:protein PAT1 homolog n=1 Tax=Selaginella moellendorffii TaxID=88036 RepID=UPI000D1D0B1B|nr:protein PAT1 homolog [Selaginella moellendorffii]XP_024544763.1 protein PAT1 homolog [Selaginella moellendorffii]XP_024544770.1 protein PAT1 homolog [Selaginella moellendorffii]XP_024544775.1 protein PAT1 homolog [Selaginella moellendorffii]XP_024544779.1 protein PAT1 homolog [Selaginella moellendorffii]|eukprot:XP_002962712.2 protein PAT1 homolog [Selaginella moellendorffii]